MKHLKKSFSVFGDEFRMYNEAQAIRRGKKRDGFAPKFFKERFNYSQPRRNEKGCGDVRITNTKTGEISVIHCDEVSRKFSHTRSPKHHRYNLRYDKSYAD